MGEQRDRRARDKPSDLRERVMVKSRAWEEPSAEIEPQAVALSPTESAVWGETMGIEQLTPSMWIEPQAVPVLVSKPAPGVTQQWLPSLEQLYDSVQSESCHHPQSDQSKCELSKKACGQDKGQLQGLSSISSTAIKHSNSVEHSPVKHSPVKCSPVDHSPVECSPVERSPVERSPVKCSPVDYSPFECNPVKYTLSNTALKHSQIKYVPIQHSTPL